MYLPESGEIDIMVTDTQGRLILNQVLEGFNEKENQVDIQLPDEPAGLYVVTICLNGKYFTSEKLVLKWLCF